MSDTPTTPVVKDLHANAKQLLERAAQDYAANAPARADFAEQNKQNGEDQ